MSEYTLRPDATYFELSWGAHGVVEPSKRRRFRSEHLIDAAVRFSERVLELDGDPKVSAGWVHLEQCDPGEESRHIIGWTKCSNERPTAEGLAA